MKERVFLKYGEKNISLEASKCSFFGKFVGLMFSRRESAKVLLFEFKENTKTGIHSLFVFFEFLAVWVDSKDNVIQVDLVKPWVLFLRPKNPYCKLVEIPINKKNKSLVESFTG